METSALGLTGKDTCVKASKPMFQELLPEVVIKCLLTTILGFVPRPSRPIRLVEAESHRLTFRSTAITIRYIGRVQEGLVPLHTDEAFGASRKL